MTHPRIGLPFFAALGLILGACGSRPSPLLPWDRDLSPPCILDLYMDGRDSILLALDEDARFLEPGPALWDSSGKGLELGCPQDAGEASTRIGLRSLMPLSPGQEYLLEGRVADLWGNSQAFLLPLWGYNPHPARLLINEVRSESSSPRCDMVELYVAGEGSSAGLCLVAGSPADHDWLWRLPAVELAAGACLVLHLKAAPGIAPVDDLESLDAAQGPDCGPWRDLWYPGEAALPGANGCLCLLGGPRGPILDALCYTDRNSSSDERYGGFGSAKFRDRVGAIAAAGAWAVEDGAVRPEDCASSVGVTETRTLCRSAGSADSDGRADWHIVPTRGATWGGPNLDDQYLPLGASTRR